MVKRIVMGIYDREYYRNEGPRYLDAFIPSGRVCKWLIGLNILFYILQLITKQERDFPVTDWLQMDTDLVLHGQIWRLLTYAFLHSPSLWQHIFFNMLCLWMFGSEIEQLDGSKEFAAFYLVAAVMGGLAFEGQALAQHHATPMLGASGAVTAIMVIYALHYPHRTILLFFFLPVPVWLLVIFQVSQDSFHLLGKTDEGVAVSAHLGGAVFAAMYFYFHWHITSLWPDIKAWRRERSRPKLRVYHPEEEAAVPVAAAARSDVDEHLDAKLDAVLEKLSRHGRESLTDPEREILQRASEIYKKKRT